MFFECRPILRCLCTGTRCRPLKKYSYAGSVRPRYRTGDHGAELGGSFAVHHPWDTESIDQHAETDRPEGLLDRHRHRPVFR